MTRSCGTFTIFQRFQDVYNMLRVASACSELRLNFVMIGWTKLCIFNIKLNETMIQCCIFPSKKHSCCHTCPYLNILAWQKFSICNTNCSRVKISSKFQSHLTHKMIYKYNNSWHRTMYWKDLFIRKLMLYNYNVNTPHLYIS